MGFTSGWGNMETSFKDRYVKSYWNYYLSLEKRLIRTEEYVAFDEVNSGTYSIEYLALLQATCSEVDVTAKAIDMHHNPSFAANGAGIKKWGYELQRHLPGITEQKVMFLKERELTPWANWTIEQRTNRRSQLFYTYAEHCGSPTWWNAYNRVKHARTTVCESGVNYHLANQENVINALAALYVLHRLMLISLDEDAYALIDRSKLFSISGRNDEIRVTTFFDSTGRMALAYEDD